MAQLRVLIAGGGTGGHIIPALAVARELVAQHSAEVLFVGTARGMEIRLVPEAGFRLRLIDVGPLKNVSLLTRLRTFVDLPRSIFACRRLMREFRPNVVFGVGGYASGPGMAAALQMKVPTLAFEPNAMPGFANRLVGKRVQAAAVNFPAAAPWFRNPEVTGIPVRPEFFTLAPAPAGPPHLLVFGGSQGARLFNQTLPGIVPALLDAVPGLTILHQSGARHAESTLAAYAASGADPSRWSVEPFLNDMPARFAQAHLVHVAQRRLDSGRTGRRRQAGPACSFRCRGGRPPDTQRRGDGQGGRRCDARRRRSFQRRRGEAVEALTALLNAPKTLAIMASAARTQAHPHAAERIANRLAELARASAVSQTAPGA